MAVQAQSTRTISDGKIKGLLVLPAVTPAPGIFVLHTAYGRVHSADAAMAEVLAKAGFVAFAPEYPLQAAPSRYVPPYLEWLKARPEVRGQKLGAVGFSAGGARVFYFAAQDRDVTAVVSYYGTYDYKTASLSQVRALPEAGPIGLVDQMNAATLIFHGDRDTESTADQVARMEQALKARGLPVETVTYPGAYHNFDRGPEAAGDRTSNGTIVQYNSSAATDAQRRTVEWFTRYLK
jgi:dienelactone hydrolase